MVGLDLAAVVEAAAATAAEGLEAAAEVVDPAAAKAGLAAAAVA